jgi:response regulator RpfG family c-di-GMP phosphodiesterase
LRLPDSNGIDTLVEIKKYARQTPIIIQTGSADETLIVKSFQLGVGGYLKKENIDSNLLVYAIRLAIEKQNYIATVEQDSLQQQDLEVRELEQIANTVKTQVTARMFGSESLRESLPDMFVELVREYGNLMDLALEERAYKVEHNISEQLRILAEKLGFLKAGPRDVIDIHTKTLKEKNENVTLAKTQAYVSEGRLRVLELMGYLTSYYRKYYIGLNNMNLSFNPNLDRRDR